MECHLARNQKQFAEEWKTIGNSEYFQPSYKRSFYT